MYQAPELESLQVGYSVKPTGESLVGEGNGHGLKKWVVIGYEKLCGDPIFIDTSLKGFPVYTAAHGEGRWDPRPVGVSLEGFGKALTIVAEAARGREYPNVLGGFPRLCNRFQMDYPAAISNDAPSLADDDWAL